VIIFSVVRTSKSFSFAAAARLGTKNKILSRKIIVICLMVMPSFMFKIELNAGYGRATAPKGGRGGCINGVYLINPP
jgi:hypothetical protein